MSRPASADPNEVQAVNPPCCFLCGDLVVDVHTANDAELSNTFGADKSRVGKLSPAQWAQLIAAIAAAIAQILGGMTAKQEPAGDLGGAEKGKGKQPAA